LSLRVLFAFQKGLGLRKKNVISLTFHLALLGSPGGFDLGIQQKISLTQDGFAR
jgi:hypothetical protein